VISLVAAVSRNGVIGRDGGLPWHVSSDLKRFKAITMGKPIIMGRKTWKSLPQKPLTGRRNIVISRRAAPPDLEGAVWARSAQEALALAGDADEICVIGGGEVYALFLPMATRIYLTEVQVEVDGDTSFPVLKGNEWKEVSREAVAAGPKDTTGFVLRVLERV
jgi:dihydrofolate reductase